MALLLPVVGCLYDFPEGMRGIDINTSRGGGGDKTPANFYFLNK